MAGHFRVDHRGRRIYQFLLAHQHQGFTLVEICNQLGLAPGATTRRAITRAAEMAHADGLWIPNACPQNGNTYRVTDRIQYGRQSGDQLTRIERGVRQTNRHRNLSLVRARDPVADRLMARLELMQEQVDGIMDEVIHGPGGGGPGPAGTPVGPAGNGNRGGGGVAA